MWRAKETNQEAATANDLKKTMMKSTGEEEKVREIVEEILDVFSQTSLEMEDNRTIIAETIARELNYEKK
jgi:hypothetical protein